MNKKITTIQIGIILLTLATAVIHLQLLFPDPLFIMNALGYLAFLGAFFLPIGFLQKYHRLVRWGFMGYTAITILAWFVMGDPTMTLGWVTKAIEIGLVVLLFLDSRQKT